MSLWAIIPVKPLRRGKSRLAEILSEDERKLLNQSLLEHTLKTVSEVPEISQTIVISRDTAALALARDFGARTILEEGNPALNMALRRATVLAKAYATRGVFILPADIPLLNAPDLQKMLSYAEPSPVVVINPDRHHEGTNALLVCPTGLIEYAYGPGSFARHCERARSAGARLEICDFSAIGLDLDVPADLTFYRALEGKPAGSIV
jgi:2-phospho-L-lactate/phosphoenolpyruvate guanylyltransferase